MAVLDELVGILGFDLRGEGEARKYNRTLDQTEGNLKRLSVAGVALGNVLASAVVGGLRLVAGAAKDVIQDAVAFEDAMADIAKVVDATPEQLGEFGDEILKMSRELPVAASGLAAIAAEAGAAGVAFEDLEGFTRQVAIAVTAFDLPAEQVGEIMAKLGNVFGFNVEQMGLFNDTINHLSNNMAAKAGELLDFTNRAAGAANLLGLTADQLAGVGAALIASGVRSETAARGLNALATRVQTDALGVNAALKSVGLSTKELQRQLAEDGDEALLGLFEKLAELPIDEQATALKALVGQDFSDDFSKLLGNPELLAQAFGLANDEAGKLGSALREYEARAATTSAKWQRIKGIIKSVGIIVVGPLLTAFKKVADAVFIIAEALDNGGDFALALVDALKSLGFEFDEGRLLAVLDGVGMLVSGFGDLESSVLAIRTLLSGLGFSASSDQIEAWVVGAQDAAGRVQEVFQHAMGTVGTAIAEHAGRLRDIFANIDFASIGDAIGEFDLLGKAVDLIKSGLDAVGSILGGLSTLATSAFGTLITNLTNFAEGEVFNQLTERLSGVVDTFGEIFGRLSEFFADETTRAVLADFGIILGEVATVLAQVAASGALAFFEGLGVALNTLFDVIGKIAEGDILGALSSLASGLETIAGIGFGAVADVFTAINDSIARMTGVDFAQIASDMSAAFQGLLGEVDTWFTGLVDKFFALLVNALEDVVNWFVRGINKGLEAIGVDPIAESEFADRAVAEREVTRVEQGTGPNVHRSDLTPEEARRRMQLDPLERARLAREDAAATGGMPVPTEQVAAVAAIPAATPAYDSAQIMTFLGGLEGAGQTFLDAARTQAAIEATAPVALEETTTIDNTQIITNTITTPVTVNQTVTGPTAAAEAGAAAQRGAQRGTDRGLTVANQGAAD